jgi:dihydroorotate dehydrogenase
LFTLPPEAAHRAAMLALKLGRPCLPLLAPWLRLQDPRLETTVFGLRFPNPVGLAAGYDKAAEAVDCWPGLGFGFMELGTFTSLAQPGNPKPRIFRLPSEEGLINSMGFPNPGAAAVAARLKALKEAGRWPKIPVGINIGKSKAADLGRAREDYLASTRLLAGYADYLAVNVSSPNTPGLRSLQAPRELKGLVAAIKKAALGRPVLVKLAPDMGLKELKRSIEAAASGGCSGLIVTNTTIGRESLPLGRYPEGGLSGRPLGPKSLVFLKETVSCTRGKMPVIAAGGVFCAEDARCRLEAGASLVQVYTGYVYEGPGMVRRLCQGLLHCQGLGRKEHKNVIKT